MSSQRGLHKLWSKVVIKMKKVEKATSRPIHDEWRDCLSTFFAPKYSLISRQLCPKLDHCFAMHKRKIGCIRCGSKVLRPLNNNAEIPVVWPSSHLTGHCYSSQFKSTATDFSPTLNLRYPNTMNLQIKTGRTQSRLAGFLEGLEPLTDPT